MDKLLKFKIKPALKASLVKISLRIAAEVEGSGRFLEVGFLRRSSNEHAISERRGGAFLNKFISVSGLPPMDKLLKSKIKPALKASMVRFLCESRLEWRDPEDFGRSDSYGAPLMNTLGPSGESLAVKSR
ncbi:hypothetical protein AVEN_71275-1 [Araneus ventricosus]|uniref:Uncharacterized protein n=1 Tax=Araneus ventricosus TaxID=182803 RepID=A0A4Y2SYJ7_ARAVE|nr:hypothetical protein AVEN_71275-1 [Araneus ventricosus]